jgi:hypothetical protein
MCTYSPSLRSSTLQTTASTVDMSTGISDDTTDAASGSVGSSTGTAGSWGGTLSGGRSTISTPSSLVSASCGDVAIPGGVVSRLTTVLNVTVSDSSSSMSSIVSWSVYEKKKNQFKRLIKKNNCMTGHQ